MEIIDLDTLFRTLNDCFHDIRNTSTKSMLTKFTYTKVSIIGIELWHYKMKHVHRHSILCNYGNMNDSGMDSMNMKY